MTLWVDVRNQLTQSIKRIHEGFTQEVAAHGNSPTVIGPGSRNSRPNIALGSSQFGVLAQCGPRSWRSLTPRPTIESILAKHPHSHLKRGSD